MYLKISATPSNTPSNTPTYTPTGTICPTSTATSTPTPTPTTCYNPQAFLIFDINNERFALNDWMASQGSTFRGMNLTSPSLSQPTFEAQMNAYISYTGWGLSNNAIMFEPVSYNEDPIYIINSNSFSTFTWVSAFVPICAHCPGSYTNFGDGAIQPISNTSYSNMIFYYSGSNVQQGYYRLYTTKPSTANRYTSASGYYEIGGLTCTGITPTPTVTKTSTSTPTLTPTNTITPSVTPSNTATQTNTPTNTTTPTETPSITPTSTIGTTPTPTSTITNSPTSTSTNTPTPSITNSPTITSTSTPTTTPTYTPTSTVTCCAIDILTNGSLDVDITAVTVDGTSANYVGGQALPNTPGNGTNLCSTVTGTVDVRVSVFNSTAGQKITLCDSNGVCTCQTITGTGPANFDFLDVFLDCTTTMTILAEDGTC